jgi:uncharacterized protein (UPF0332 family)
LDPSDFLELTKLVSTGGTPQTEPFFRSAVSRAYYAVHLGARELYLSRRKISPNSKGIISHRMMIRALKGSELPGLGHKLDQLLDARLTADYDLRSLVLDPELRNAVVLADLILKDLPLSVGKPRSPRSRPP